MHGENESPLTLTFPLRVKWIQVTGEGQELHPTSPFPTMKNTIIGIYTRACRVEDWEMTL